MGRTKLSEKYHDEREEICKKLLEIVGTEFYLCDLDNDPEKQYKYYQPIQYCHYLLH